MTRRRRRSGNTGLLLLSADGKGMMRDGMRTGAGLRGTRWERRDE